MAFPSAPADQDKHIINQDTYQFNSAKNRWELIDDLDATELNLDSEEHDRKAADSDLRHLIAQVDSDLAILFARTDSDEGTLQVLETTMLQRIDSERHDWQAGDSDIYQAIRDEEHDRKAADSDLSDRISLEIHDRAAADSDLQVQVFDNDSDIKMARHDAQGWDSDVDDHQ